MGMTFDPNASVAADCASAFSRSQDNFERDEAEIESTYRDLCHQCATLEGATKFVTDSVGDPYFLVALGLVLHATGSYSAVLENELRKVARQQVEGWKA